MYNPDGVELGLPRQNASGIDIESGWDDAVQQPEVTVLRNRFIELMNAPEPIEVALNILRRSPANAILSIITKRHIAALHHTRKQFIGVQSYFPTGIEPWIIISWANGTPDQCPGGG